MTLTGTRTRTAGAFIVLALTLSGCGGNNDDTAATNISASIMKSQKKASGTSSFFSMKKKDADCIGKGLVDKIGTDQLQKYKLLDKDLKTKDSVTDVKMSAGDAKKATTVLFGCTDVVKMMQGAMDKSGSVPKQMKPCVDKALNDKSLRGMFTQIFQGDQEAAKKQLVEPMMKCAIGSQGQ